jgi:hypothetical protein
VEIVGRTSDGLWLGSDDGDCFAWREDGKSVGDQNYDIIGPWIEGGLPFGVVFDPAVDGVDVKRRFVAAVEAGVHFEARDKLPSGKWCGCGTPHWHINRVYRLAGSTAEPVTPQEPELSPAQEAAVRRIVREMMGAHP